MRILLWLAFPRLMVGNATGDVPPCLIGPALGTPLSLSGRSAPSRGHDNDSDWKCSLNPSRKSSVELIYRLQVSSFIASLLLHPLRTHFWTALSLKSLLPENRHQYIFTTMVIKSAVACAAFLNIVLPVVYGASSALSACSTTLTPTMSIQPTVASGYQMALVATGLTKPRSIEFDSAG